jgi:hypothetical protein
LSIANMTSGDIFLLYCEHKALMHKHKQAPMCFSDYRTEMLSILSSINNCN